MVKSKGNLRFILKGGKWGFFLILVSLIYISCQARARQTARARAQTLACILFVCLFVSDVIIVFLCFLYINV